MVNNTSKNSAGFALLLALLVSSVALSIGLVLLNLTLKQLDLVTSSRESEVAFQTARAGMDCLQYLRYKHPELVEPGNPSIDYECLGDPNVTFNDQKTGNPAPHNDARQFYSAKINWLPEGKVAGEEQCVQIDMYIFNTTVGNAGNDIVMDPDEFGNIDRGLVDDECSDGDICTIGISRGYNRNCDEINNNNLYTVQRELTAEF